jgi:peptide/nickel transport system substrate-binding protein
MRTRKRSFLAVAGLAALALSASACGSSSSGSSGNVSLDSGLQGLNPGSGTPTKGGTLNMLGQGDVDFMDPNISYYSIGYLAQRMWIRGLYAYPAVPNKTTTVAPDLATGPPVVSNNGLTYTITIRSGAQFDTTPFSPVTAADAVIGLKRSCNPVQPFGGEPDYINLIAGMASFCAAFGNLGANATAAQMKSFIDTNNISGVTASGQTLTFTLTHPASYFEDELTLDAFNPTPEATLNFIPGSSQEAQNTYADGPYKVETYVPTKKIVFVRNPAWNASSDPIRKAYVDTINVSETGNQTTNQQILQTNSASGGMEFDAFPPEGAVPGLVAQMKSGSTQDMNMGPTQSSNPYVVFNTVSPNNSGALGKVAVRQALSYGINRSFLIEDASGPEISPPLTHILPPGVDGAQDVPANYNPYPYNPTKAKSMLAAAGFPHGFTLTLLYRPDSTLSTKMAQTIQSELTQINVTIKLLAAPSADFYTKYLEVPSVAHAGTWDLAIAGWGPDWYGNGAPSFFEPLFDGPSSYPPSGSNFGFYSNPSVTSLITQAASQASASTAASEWAQADQDVMNDAAIYPITAPLQPNYHASYVHNAVYVPAIQQFDPTNVWLSTPTG